MIAIATIEYDLHDVTSSSAQIGELISLIDAGTVENPCLAGH